MCKPSSRNACPVCGDKTIPGVVCCDLLIAELDTDDDTQHGQP